MAAAVMNWMLDLKHKGDGERATGIGEYHDGTWENWSHTRSSTHPHHYRDGAHYWVSKYDLTPDTDWL